MTPEEFRARLEEAQTLIGERLAEVKQNPKWASENERGELVEVPDNLGDQMMEFSVALELSSDDEGSEED